MKILRNFLTIHFFGKILTHASMGDCFFLYATPLPLPNHNVTRQERQIVFICNLYVSGIVVLGGQSSHFTLLSTWGDLTSHRIAKTNLTWQVI